MGLLTDIVERVRADMVEHPPNEGHLWMRTRALPAAGDLRAALQRPGTAIIGQVERASPWAGEMPDVDPGDQAAAYESGGAAAVSILTEPRHFGGSLLEVRAARRRTDLPILRNDFIVHPAQVLEARAEGADAVVLVVAALSELELEALLGAVRDVGLQAVMEAHDEAELERALATGEPLVGVNARDLETLDVDVNRALSLSRRVPPDRVVILEGAVSTRADVERAEAARADAVLVGEALMRSSDPARTTRRLRGGLSAIRG